MASYAFTATANLQSTANLATDKVRISTSTSGVQYNASFPNVALTGTVTCATNSNALTGSGTTFLTQLSVGAWVGNTSGNTVGIVRSITSNTAAVLQANAAVAIAGATARYNPYGVPYTVATANSELIPPNTMANSVYVGQGNVITFLTPSGVTGALFTITELGMPYANKGTASGFGS